MRARPARQSHCRADSRRGPRAAAAVAANAPAARRSAAPSPRSLGFRRRGIVRPALDLPRHIVFAAAVIGEPDRRRLEPVSGASSRSWHRNPGAFGGFGRRHLRFPEHAALDMSHHEECRADDGFIGAIEHWFGNRKILSMQRADDTVLAVHRVRGWQAVCQAACAAARSAAAAFPEIGRIGLAALELAHHDWAGEAGYVRARVVFQPCGVEAEPLGDVVRAGKSVLAVGLSSCFFF